MAMQTLCACLAALLVLCLSAAAGANDRQLKPVKLKVGFLNHSEVSCRYAQPCYKVMPGADTEYDHYQGQAQRRIQKAKDEHDSAEKIQELIIELKTGIEAREKLFGRCPGRCLSYDFPVIFKHAADEVARSKGLDVVLDILSVFYGADKILLNGKDVNDPTFEALKVQRAH